MAKIQSLPPTLHIDGLPGLTGAMKSGCLYAIATGASSIKLSVMVASITASLAQGIHCALIAASVMDIESESAQALWGDKPALNTGCDALQIFIGQDNFKENIVQFGIERFTKELDLFEIPSDSYLWIQQAEDLFLLENMPFAVKQASIFKDWLAMRNITAVLGFSTLSEIDSRQIHLLFESLDGLCKIEQGAAGLEVKFRYWHSRDGAADRERYALIKEQSGFYSAQALSQEQQGTVPETILARSTGQVDFAQAGQQLARGNDDAAPGHSVLSDTAQNVHVEIDTEKQYAHLNIRSILRKLAGDEHADDWVLPDDVFSKQALKKSKTELTPDPLPPVKRPALPDDSQKSGNGVKTDDVQNGEGVANEAVDVKAVDGQPGEGVTNAADGVKTDSIPRGEGVTHDADAVKAEDVQIGIGISNDAEAVKADDVQRGVGISNAADGVKTEGVQKQGNGQKVGVVKKMTDVKSEGVVKKSRRVKKARGDKLS